MNILSNFNKLARAIRNMVRTGLVVRIDPGAGRCRVQSGGTMHGNIKHSGDALSSNDKVLHTHQHPGDSGGTTGAPL